MIKYSLVCTNGHTFEGWFSNGAEYDVQCRNGLLSCPVCDTAKIEKTLMTPSISAIENNIPSHSNNVAVTPNTDIPEQYAQAISQLREMKTRIMAGAEDVGQNFPEEARKIYYGESKKRGIYGQAGTKDIKGLIDEGIEIIPLPVLPEDKN